MLRYGSVEKLRIMVKQLSRFFSPFSLLFIDAVHETPVMLLHGVEIMNDGRGLLITHAHLIDQDRSLELIAFCLIWMHRSTNGDENQMVFIFGTYTNEHRRASSRIFTLFISM